MSVVSIGPHERMTPDECVSLCAREVGEYQDVMVLAYDKDGELMVRSSGMKRADAVFMLLAALDHARGRV